MPKRKKVTYVESAAALKWAQSQVGAREGGSNNTGERVQEYQRADGLWGEVYSWCMSFQQWCRRRATGAKRKKIGSQWQLIGGEYLAKGTASVGMFVAWALERGYVVAGRPRRTDYICLLFDDDNWADHVGQIERVLPAAPGLLYLQTIEGNTGSSGAVSDPGTGRDGVYRKRRLVRRSRCIIIRVPDQARA